ncbi:hypothetical protein [Cronobacter malonaticus]|uniref:glycine-rich domain-containing protein n=1 Tax=Cronobacter malonaticus TaxID=413503 RepID=UPI00351830C6
MSAGTLTLTNKSAAVTGTGTSFTTELKVGDFIVFNVGGAPYTIPVKSITSNTQLTLISNYTGPTQSGVAWFSVPQEAQSLISSALATQSAEALRGLNYDKMNWQQVFSSNDNITVTLPDGSTFTGPAWLKLVSMLNNRLAKDKNLSDLPDKSAALINLGLGDGKGRLIGLKVITASGIYSPTPGTSFIYAELVGGGGGGGGATTTTSGQYSPAGGGGGGGYTAKLIRSGFSGLQINIGAGGLGATGGSASGDPGGPTTFAGMTAPGGGGGQPGGTTTSNNTGGGGGAGGALGSGGDINKSGQPGEGGVSYSASSFAGSGGGNAKFPFGGGARRASNNPGIAPTEPGCGGGGGNNNANQTATRTGASGSAGVAIIWEYA